MIMIDILVPPLDAVYDIELDEQITAKQLRESVEKLIGEKENLTFSVAKRELFLYRKGDFLKEDVPLILQGIVNADRLILV